jgi:hypothetical protein
MPSLAQKKWAFASAIILFLYWAFVFSMPLLIASQEFRSSDALGFWAVLCVAIGYFSFTGIRAWRRRWKARFVLRIVVPAALLVISSTLVGLFGW